MYVCGLTPSAEAHLGHARSFLFFDVLRRYLTYCGQRVTYVRNVTDIDDRSIAAARETGVTFDVIVAGFYESFRRSMDRLHVLEPDHEPHATHYVAQMIDMIAVLVERENAYVAPDGVYFAVQTFARYGALSGRHIDELMIGARIAPDEGKRDPLDFALWKFAKPGEPAWPSPWGEGRPGWHIECSAMLHELLGEPIDIHGGGFDLIFPHHENEIAQTESVMAEQMANVWMHGGLLLFDGKKMSKSLGNFEPLSDLLDRHDPQAIRMLFLQSGYRKPMNFTEDSIAAATTGLRRLQATYDALRAAPATVHDELASRHAVDAYATRFYAALDDDMNTSGAISVVFDLAGAAQELVARGAANHAAAFVHQALGVLGISPLERGARAEAVTEKTHTVDRVAYKIVRRGPASVSEAALERLRTLVGEIVQLESFAPPEAVDAVVEARIKAKSEKDFALADKLREALAEAGVVLADSKEGTTWSASG
jgi:cysteinyl-tRNA synthetase